MNRLGFTLNNTWLKIVTTLTTMGAIGSLLTSCSKAQFNFQSLSSAGTGTSSSSGSGTVSDAPLPCFNSGAINKLVRSGNTIYVAGSFTQMGPCTGTGATWDLDSNNLSKPMPVDLRINGAVRTAISDGNGGWYIGGDFSQVGSISRAGVAHLNSDLSLDTTFTNLSPSGSIYALALSGTKLYIGGSFSWIGGSVRNNLAAVDSATGAITSFNPNLNSTVNAMLVSGSYLYVAGNFNTINVPVTNALYGGLARFDLSTQVLDSGFCAGAGATTNGPVNAIASAGSTLYFGGNFSLSLCGQSRTRLAAYDGSVFTGFNSTASIAPNGQVLALVTSASNLYLGGSFSYVGASPVTNIASVGIVSGTMNSFNVTPSGSVFSLALSGSNLYLGGNFFNVNSTTRNYVAAVDAITGTLSSAFNLRLNGNVLALAGLGNKLYVGGNFTYSATINKNYLASIDATTGAIIPSFNAYPSGYVNDILLSDGVLYLAGGFTQVNGTTRLYLASVDSTFGSLNTNFDPNVSAAVSSIALSGSTLYLSGSFATVGGMARPNLAAVDTYSGALITTFAPAPNGYVNQVLVSDDKLYVAGNFTSIGGQSRTGVAQLLASDGLATSLSFNAGLNNSASAVSLNGSTLYIGGIFSQVNSGTPRLFLAAVDATTGINISTFSPNITGGSSVNTLALMNGQLYIGGGFSNFSTGIRYGLAMVNSSTGTMNLSFNANVNAGGSVNRIIPHSTGSSGKHYILGSFTSAGGQPMSGVATLLPSTGEGI